MTHFFSINKATRDLGYVPKISSTLGAKRLADYYSQNGPGGVNFNKNFFRFVNPFVGLLIFAGMVLLYTFAFLEYSPSSKLK